MIVHPDSFLPRAVYWEGQFYQIDFQEEQCFESIGLGLDGEEIRISQLAFYLADLQEGMGREQELKNLMEIVPMDESIEFIREIAYMQVKRVVAFELMRLPDMQQFFMKSRKNQPTWWLMDRELVY